MASTSFTNNVTLTDDDWFNDVDTAAYSYLTSVSGTDTITATGPSSMTAYAAGQRFRFLPAATNTGATTINITGASTLGAKSVFCGGAACVGGEIRSGIPVEIIYDGTQFNIAGPYSGGAVPGDIACAGGVTSSHATDGIGYATGAGGTVTQATNKSTGVTLNKATGQITMNNANLAAATIVSFTLTNSAIDAADLLVLNHISGGTAGAYTINAQCGSGSASINVRNATAGDLAEAIVISFAVVKAVTA